MEKKSVLTHSCNWCLLVTCQLLRLVLFMIAHLGNGNQVSSVGLSFCVHDSKSVPHWLKPVIQWINKCDKSFCYEYTLTLSMSICIAHYWTLPPMGSVHWILLKQKHIFSRQPNQAMLDRTDEYCEDQGSLVYIQSTPPSATCVTNPSGHQPTQASFHYAEPQHLYRRRYVNEVACHKDCRCLLRDPASSVPCFVLQSLV